MYDSPLLRYGLRPPLTASRLSLSPDGHVLYQLRRPWPRPGGATHLVLEPLEFLHRLSALLPRPYAHALRYFGCFSNHSAARKLLPKPPADPGGPEASAGPAVEDTASQDGRPVPSPRRRLLWHQLLRRVLFVEGLACPRCSSAQAAVPMVVLAFLSDPPVVERILKHLKLPFVPTPLAPARSLAHPSWRAGTPIPIPFPENAVFFDLPHSDSTLLRGEEEEGAGMDGPDPPASIRPPP